MKAGFDAHWYLAVYPDVRDSGLDPETHYILYGRLEGRWPTMGHWESEKQMLASTPEMVPTPTIELPARSQCDVPRHAALVLDEWQNHSKNQLAHVADDLRRLGFHVSLASAKRHTFPSASLLEELGASLVLPASIDEAFGSQSPYGVVDVFLGGGTRGISAAELDRRLHVPQAKLIILDTQSPEAVVGTQASADSVYRITKGTEQEAGSRSFLIDALARANAPATEAVHREVLLRGVPSTALTSREPTESIVIFGVIDWHYRVQRPQQIAMELARQGRLVYYVNPSAVSGPCHRLMAHSSPQTNIIVLQVQTPLPFGIGSERLSPQHAQCLARALRHFAEQVPSRPAIAVVDHPYWSPLAFSLADCRVVYDCLDHFAGFMADHPAWAVDEAELIREAELVLVTSEFLESRVAEIRGGSGVVELHNAAWDPENMALPPRNLERTRPTFGYVGAVSEWFDFELLTAVCRLRPQYEFQIYGRITDGRAGQLAALSNVTLQGEIENSLVPGLLLQFDVGLIPLALNDLTTATDPVKAYEYLAVGIPVVATDLPELRRFPAHSVSIGRTPEEFAECLDEALRRASNDTRRNAAIAWARANTWQVRVKTLLEALDGFPHEEVRGD